jgi:hypothetical protein
MAVTFAFGTDAPVESLTTPVSTAVGTCAAISMAKKSIPQNPIVP